MARGHAGSRLGSVSPTATCYSNAQTRPPDEDRPMTSPDRPAPISDLKITDVEAIYLRLPDVKAQCDSGQDALLVKITTDAGIVGYGEVDSAPMAVKWTIEGPFSHTLTTGLKHVLVGEDPFLTEYLWQ